MLVIQHHLEILLVIEIELETSITEICPTDPALHIPDSRFWEKVDQSVNAPTL